MKASWSSKVGFFGFILYFILLLIYGLTLKTANLLALKFTFSRLNSAI
jgi:hypothetical protein